MLARVVAGVHSPTESSSPLLPLIQPTRHVKKYLLLRWPSRSAFLVATLSAIAASLLIYDLSSFFSRHSSDQGQAYFTNPLGWYEAGGGSLMPVDSTSGPVVRPIAQESNSSAISDWPSYPTIDPFLLELHEMISGTKGFYVRDYSLGLGWNNVTSSLFSGCTIFEVAVTGALPDRGGARASASSQQDRCNPIIRLCARL